MGRSAAGLSRASTKRVGEAYFLAHWSGQVYPLTIPELGHHVPDVSRVLHRMMAKRPEDRYPDLAKCKRELAAALAQDAVEEKR